VTTWATPPLASRLADIAGGRYLLRPDVALFLLAGWVFGVARVSRNRRWAVALVLAPAGFILLARFVLHRYGDNAIAVQLENRGIGLVTVIALFCLAAGMAWATRRARVLGDVAALVAAGVLVVSTAGPWVHIARQMAVPSRGIQDAARVVAADVPSGARFAEVRQFPDDANAASVPHPDFWLIQASGRPALNEFNVESTVATEPAFLPEHLLDIPAARAADRLAGVGVTHVVAATARARDHLLASDRFTMVWQEGSWSVLRVSPSDGHPDPASQLSTVGPASATLQRGDAEHLRIGVRAATATDATVALGWSPRWRVTVNGRRARAHRDTNGMVAFRLPAGDSVVRVDFGGDPWEAVGVLVTVLTLVVGVLLVATRPPASLATIGRRRGWRGHGTGLGDRAGGTAAGGDGSGGPWAGTATATPTATSSTTPTAPALATTGDHPDSPLGTP